MLTGEGWLPAITGEPTPGTQASGGPRGSQVALGATGTHSPSQRDGIPRCTWPRGIERRLGLPWWLSGKESACQCRKHRFDSWVGEIPWRRKWQPTPVCLPGNPRDRGARWAAVHGVAESDLTEQTRAFHHLFKQCLKLSVLLPICCFTHITLKVCKCYLHKFLKVVSGSKRVCFSF